MEHIQITAQAVAEAIQIERERCAKMIEHFTEGQIRMAAGEMTAQEMRTVKAVQRWWAAALRVTTQTQC